MTYLARWTAARLIVWWCSTERFATSSMIAIGYVRGQLRGAAPALKPRLMTEIARTLEGLFAQMHHEIAPCCWDETRVVERAA